MLSKEHFVIQRYILVSDMAIKNLLQSDKLEKAHGPIHIEVLKHDKHTREVFLSDQKGIKREYAITFFSKNPDKDLAAVNRKIKSGGLIGKTFRDGGYDIIKRKKKNFTIELTERLKKEFSTNKNSAKSSIYEFYVKKGTGSLKLYGTIFEIYNPK